MKSSTELRAGGTAMVEKVAFCPTQEAVLASTGGDGLCRLWDVRVGGGGAVGAGKGREIAECKTGDTGLFLSWHPSGDSVLVGRKDDAVMAVDVRKMEPGRAVGVDGQWRLGIVRLSKTRDNSTQWPFRTLAASCSLLLEKDRSRFLTGLVWSCSIL